MKVAVIGSRSLVVTELGTFIPQGTKELVSGGAKGIDTCVREFAEREGIKLTEFFPDYRLFGRGAPLRRNLQIIEYSDVIVAFWDGRSRGTAFVIKQCTKIGKPIKVYKMF